MIQMADTKDSKGNKATTSSARPNDAKASNAPAAGGDTKYGRDPQTGRALTQDGRVRSERRESVFMLINSKGEILFLSPSDKVCKWVKSFQEMGQLKVSYPADKFKHEEMKIQD